MLESPGKSRDPMVAWVNHALMGFMFGQDDSLKIKVDVQLFSNFYRLFTTMHYFECAAKRTDYHAHKKDINI